MSNINNENTFYYIKKAASYLHEREEDHHKYQFGHCLALGGSTGMTGALILSSTAALSVGAGLVTAITHKNNYSELISQIPIEIMTGTFESRLMKNLDKFSTVIMGPGLGQSKKAREVVQTTIKNTKHKLVIDADAINVLNFKKDENKLKDNNVSMIFTPHLGEFSRMLNLKKEIILENPMYYLSQFTSQFYCGVILKNGPTTYLSWQNSKPITFHAANHGMATAGSGDVLSGILGGLLAQTNDSNPINIMLLSVVVHSLAGKIAAKKMGKRSMTASSIISCFPETFQEIEKYKE